jgi:RNA polymerase sigma-70 factor, ECF subfamily
MGDGRVERECVALEEFLNSPSAQSFEALFAILTPQLTAFFRARRCDFSVAEDLAQEAMLTVYRKAGQLRDRTLFRPWLFRVARNLLYRHFASESHALEVVEISAVADRLALKTPSSAGPPGFEFGQWMGFLNSRESEVMRLRFLEQWEYHEIAAAHGIPLGTVQSRLHSAKKKLAPHLMRAAA